MAYSIIGTAILIAIYALWKYFCRTDKAKIPGIPEIPGWPIFGSLIELGEYHARVAKKWAKKYGPVFQVRLGNRRIVFANSYSSVRELWIDNQSALISRPKLHTFHSIVSDSSTFTIGTSPWDESCKRRRKAAATALNIVSTRGYMPIIDLESTLSISELYYDSAKGTKELDPIAYFQRFALNTSLTLNYGFRIDNPTLLEEIYAVERGISNFRSTSNNWEDYIPLLRLIKSTHRGGGPLELKERRATYMKMLLDTLRDKIDKRTDRPCITGNILKDPEAKLSQAEIDSICLTMVSAGLDTIPGNIIMGIGVLSTPDGQIIQRKAYDAIMAAYPDHNAWHACLYEEKIAYVTAFYKETLRFFTVIPISLPRVSIKDIIWNGITFPADTTFYMNAYAANYDENQFDNPHIFAPERYLVDEDQDSKGQSASHFAYGAGSRICAGSHLANRELYIAFVRLICAFEIVESADPEARPVIDAIDANSNPTSLTTDPKKFKVSFKIRDEAKLETWIKESENATKGLRQDVTSNPDNNL